MRFAKLRCERIWYLAARKGKIALELRRQHDFAPTDGPLHELRSQLRGGEEHALRVGRDEILYYSSARGVKTTLSRRLCGRGDCLRKLVELYVRFGKRF